MTRCTALTLCLCALLGVGLAASPAEADYIWIEGENPSTTPEITPPEGNPDDRGYGFGGWGRTELISAGSMLHMSISADQVEPRLGREGAVFTYEFTVERAGRYTLWSRIGYEWVRSPFAWRVNDEEWQTLPPDQPTIDVVPLERWNELGWVKLGEAELKAGEHTIAFRHQPYTVTQDGEERPGRILHTLDAICIHSGHFRPNGHRRPDADYKEQKDLEAAKHIFELTDDGSARPAVVLNGLWETARWDEREYDPATRLQGPTTLPDSDRLYWYGIGVPHLGRHAELPEHAFSHRFLLRTRVHVPTSMQDRGFVLEFQGFRMIASVFVNGKHCGWSRNFDALWQCDLTGAVRPGEVNEIIVVIKSEHYAIDPDQAKGDALGEQVGLRRWVNVPWDMRFTQSVGKYYDMPVANADVGPGIREPVRLLAVGKTWVEDVFAKPSVRHKRLGLELTLKNSTARQTTVTVENAVRRWSPDGLGDEVEKAFATREVSVPAGELTTFELSETWEDPALYFPDDPKLYTIVTTVKADGRVVDTKHTRFGFREITWDGDGFYLNGVPWQFWADSEHEASVEAFIARAKESGQNAFRYANWHMRPWKTGSPRAHLNALDEAGIAVRASGTFDGMGAQYGPGLAQGAGDERTWNRALFEHAAEQARAWIRGLRNHPSVVIWSYENEITFINSANLGMSVYVEPGVRWLGEQVMKTDPTRPAMVDGGRALRPAEEWRNAPPEVVALGHLPLNGCHYNERPLREYPDAAYTNDYLYTSRHRGFWPMAPDRPIVHGEIFFANGYQPSQLAQIGGETCFIGPGETAGARDLMQRMLYEGMRWNNTSHFMHTSTARSSHDYWHAWSPVALFVREWDRAFGSGQAVTRTLRLVNSTSKQTPVDAAWELVVDGRSITKGSRTLNVAAGGRSEPFTITLTMPEVERRTSGELILTAHREGQLVFREAKPISVINTHGAPRPTTAEGDLVVLDPAGEARSRLEERAIAFTEINSIDQIELRPQTLIIGRNAVPADRAADRFWQHLLLAGARIVVLEQNHPLRYQALPADFDLSSHAGSIAFGEDFSHPVLAGLDQNALFCWQNEKGHQTYRGVYRKATRGARSLVQCDAELGFTALAECRLKEGTLLVCQLLVGQSMANNPVAQRLFDNMVSYAAGYQPTRKATAVVMAGDSLRTGLLEEIELDFKRLDDPVEALRSDAEIVIVDATPPHLATLVNARDDVERFTADGGWLMLWGVDPEGLADFNRLVGVNHLMRPFLREKVTIAVPRDPLTAGLTLRDVAMDTGTPPTRFWNAPWAVNDAYTHIVDLRDVAPFMDFEGRQRHIQQAKEGPQNQNNPLNMFNGFTADQWWQYLYYIGFENERPELTFHLPRRQTLEKLSIVPNDHLWQMRTIEVYADDASEPSRVLSLEVGRTQQDFDLNALEAGKLRLVLTDMQNTNPNRPDRVTGIENLQIFARRSAAWEQKVRPLLNIGGLVAYNRGEGGILLNQLHIKPRELNPATVRKKQAIVKTLLGNLGAVVGSVKPVVVGTSLVFEPVAIPDETYNAYNRRQQQPGWFRSGEAPDADLTALPEGRAKFEGVLYQVPEFQTSIVPSVIMLRGEGSAVEAAQVEGIEVERAVDALFFLHTFHKGREIENYERSLERGRRDAEADPPTLFRYRVNYADGQSLEAPVRWNEGVSHWLQQAPRPLRFAQVAWAAPVEGHSGWQTTVYSMQWNNPRPEVVIESIDILPSDERNAHRLGAPAVIAITTARIP